MSLKYFDSASGRERYKRRYVWSGWAFIVGFALGLIAAHLI
ncbi:MAG TPA: hypothetical protein VFA75_00275 [Nevskia sp.]|nr:hypothetical protein [Nevskia sp.]